MNNPISTIKNYIQSLLKNQIRPIKSTYRMEWTKSVSNEVAHSLSRIGITFFSYIVLQTIYLLYGSTNDLQLMAVQLTFVYFLLSLPYCYFTYRFNQTFLWRKHAMAVIDVSVISFATFSFGTTGAAIYPIYLWLTIGNGLRFGPKFLHYSAALSIIGFTIAVVASPMWRNQIELAAGLGIGIVIMPLFFLALLDTLSKTNKLLQKKIDETQHMATHDTLTQLPNRVLLEEQLEKAITKAKINHHQLGIFYIDVNSFKSINDTLGHLAGDELIIQFSQRLSDCLRSSDMLARLSGDEFMMILDSQQTDSYSDQIAERMLKSAVGHYNLNGYEIFVGFSAGIAVYPFDGTSVSELIKNADVALHCAKKNSQSNYKFYNKDMSKEVSKELTIQTELRRALENNEFELYYQAQVDASTKKLHGVEALLRWNHPENGLLSPAEFIDVAEKHSLMIDLGKWIIEQACKDRAEWNALGKTDIVTTINVSGLQFMEENFVDSLLNTLQKYNIKAGQIGLEITERILIEERDIVHAVFKKLKSMNIELSLDDFGTGYSSLSYLKRFPIDCIKVDRSFIRDIPDNAEDCSLVQTIIAIGKNLNMRVIAEGVETQAQFDALKSWGCGAIQGYYFHQPTPENILKKRFLSENNPVLAHSI